MSSSNSPTSLSTDAIKDATRRRLPAWAGYLLSFVVVMALDFYVYRAYINHPWFVDDFDYLKRPDLQLKYDLRYWDPTWPWYFRPVFNTYIDLVMTGFHRSLPAVHAAGIAVTGVIFWLLGVLAYRLAGWGPAVLSVVFFCLAPHKDEAIWWPAGSNTLMASVFFFATLVMWHIWRSTNKRQYYAVLLLTLIYALCGKEESLALAIILPLFDFYLRPTMAWKNRIAAFVPVYAIIGVFCICSHIAYGYAVKADPKGALFAFEPLRRSIILLHFADFSFIASYFQLPSAETLVANAFPLILIALSLQRRDRLSATILAMAMVGTLPNPLGTGMHSASERFHFLPASMIALAYAIGFWRLAQSRKLSTRLVAAAIAINFLLCHASVGDFLDPVVGWTAMFAVTAIGLVGWRAGILTGRDYAIGCAAIVGCVLLPWSSFGYADVVWSMLVFVLGAIAMRKEDWLAGGVIAFFLVSSAHVAVPVYWVCAWLARRQAARSTKSVSVPQASELQTQTS